MPGQIQKHVVVLTALAAVWIFLGGEAMAMRIESPAFQDKGKIPVQYTCDGAGRSGGDRPLGQPVPGDWPGADLSPPLTWSDPPPGTQSFALISDDPDAPIGTWVHWVVYGLPAGSRELREGIPKTETLADGTQQGITDFGRPGYNGPCPPAGKPHRYFFKLFALDTALALPPKMTKTDLLVAMNGHILAQAELVGTYQR